jgi:hypothetical protein
MENMRCGRRNFLPESRHRISHVTNYLIRNGCPCRNSCYQAWYRNNLLLSVLTYGSFDTSGPQYLCSADKNALNATWFQNTGELDPLVWSCLKPSLITLANLFRGELERYSPPIRGISASNLGTSAVDNHPRRPVQSSLICRLFVPGPRVIFLEPSGLAAFHMRSGPSHFRLWEPVAVHLHGNAHWTASSVGGGKYPLGL